MYGFSYIRWSIMKNGYFDITSSIDFILDELQRSIHRSIIVIAIMLMSMVTMVVLLSNNVIYISNLLATVTGYLSLAIIIYKLYVLDKLMNYRRLMKTYLEDYNEVVNDIDIDEDARLYKATYILNVMLKELSSRTKVSVLTLVNVMDRRDSKDVKFIFT